MGEIHLGARIGEFKWTLTYLVVKMQNCLEAKLNGLTIRNKKNENINTEF